MVEDFHCPSLHAVQLENDVDVYDSLHWRTSLVVQSLDVHARYVYVCRSGCYASPTDVQIDRRGRGRRATKETWSGLFIYAHAVCTV